MLLLCIETETNTLGLFRRGAQPHAIQCAQSFSAGAMTEAIEYTPLSNEPVAIGSHEWSSFYLLFRAQRGRTH